MKTLALAEIAVAIAQRFAEKFGDLGFEGHITSKVYIISRYIFKVSYLDGLCVLELIVSL